MLKAHYALAVAGPNTMNVTGRLGQPRGKGICVMIKRQLKPEVKAALEMHGAEAVRMMLVKYPFGLAHDDGVPGLQATDGQWIKRDDAENWLLWKDEERAAETSRKDLGRFRINMVFTVVVALAAGAAVWEGRHTLFH